MRMTIDDLVTVAAVELGKVEADPDMLVATQRLLLRGLRTAFDRYGCVVLVKKPSGQFLVPSVISPDRVQGEIAAREKRGETIIGYAIKED